MRSPARPQAANWVARSGSPLLGRHVAKPQRQRGNALEVMAQRHPLRRPGPLGQRQPRPPLGPGPDRPGREPAAAVRADVEQPALHAVRAKGALIAADARIQRIRRQILVAELAVGPQLERHRSHPRANGAQGPFHSVSACLGRCFARLQVCRSTAASAIRSGVTKNTSTGGETSRSLPPTTTPVSSPRYLASDTLPPIATGRSTT